MVQPGSIHPDTGSLYVFDESGSTEPAQAPAQLLAVLTQPERKPQPASLTATPPMVGQRERAYGQKVLRDECAKFAAIVPSQGLRNAGLNLLALRVAECVAAGWLDDDVAWDAIRETAADYLLHDASAEGTLRSGWEYGMANPRMPLGERDDFGVTIGLPEYPAEAPRATVSESDPWPDPEPLGSTLPRVDKLTPDMLPISLRAMVEDIAARMQVPLDFPAVVAVQTLAGVVGRRAFIQPKRHDTSFRVTPNLWGGIVAPPSSMKSPVIKAVTGAVLDLEGEWLQEHTAAKEAFDLQSGLDELTKDAWKAGVKRAMRDGEVPPPVPATIGAAPVQKRLITSDATFEALHTMMSANPAGIFLLKDELTGWFAGLERQGREQERGFALEAWNGDGSYTVDRVGRGSIHVPHTCLSIFGGIQPSRLRAYLSDALSGGPSNDGLMQRFQLLIWPDMPEGDWVQVDRAPNAAALNKAGAIYRRLALMGSDTPLGFRFDAQAQELYTEWITVLENRLRKPGLGEVMQAHLGKYRSLMPSLGLLFALADGESERVTLHHAKLAAQWCEYLETHARRVYSSQASPERASVIALGQHIAAGDLGRQFTLRDLYRKCWHGLASKEDVLPALRELEEISWVRRIVGDADKPGRPVSETVFVNSKLGAYHGRS